MVRLQVGSKRAIGPGRIEYRAAGSRGQGAVGGSAAATPPTSIDGLFTLLAVAGNSFGWFLAWAGRTGGPHPAGGCPHRNRPLRGRPGSAPWSRPARPGCESTSWSSGTPSG